jgi:signal transduction histidine kinase
MDIKKILFRTNSIDVEKALPDGVIFCSKDGKIQWVNDKAAEIFETSKMHLLTSNISDFIENALNLITNSIIYNKPVIVKFAQKEIYFDLTTKEIEDGYVLDFRDVLQSNELPQNDENAYKEVNRDKNNFLLKLSNDLKSPLQSIVGFSQAMADGLGGNMSEQQDKYIRIIKKNSSDLMYFVGKLLELSQTEAEIKAPELKTFDIVNLINSTVRFNEQLYKGKELRWNVSVGEDMKNTVVSDEEIIKTILQNVLEVILKSVDMGEIGIAVSIPDEEFLSSKNINGGNYFLVSISSSSLLLSENDLESMFDPYKIVDTANKKNVLRAIMLACVKNLVQSLKGLVWVESQILKNTSFYILIPQGSL